MGKSTSVFAPDLLAGKRILVTGGGTGLGRGVAARLAAHGAEVHLWGRREAVLAEAAAEVGAMAAGPGPAHFRTVDVRRADLVDAAMTEIWDRHGPLAGALNNAAANFIAPTESLSPRAFEAVTSTVMAGSFHTTHAAGRRWIDQGLPGVVLSMLTTWVWTGSAFVVPSAMAKAAVHAMTMSLAVEWARYGIRLNALAPGPIPTDYADWRDHRHGRRPAASRAEHVRWPDYAVGSGLGQGQAAQQGGEHGRQGAAQRMSRVHRGRWACERRRQLLRAAAAAAAAAASERPLPPPHRAG
jgi:NAD(P)-dependent dehydrogenase (short-subunit alcohol dehydrogenase family)